MQNAGAPINLMVCMLVELKVFLIHFLSFPLLFFVSVCLQVLRINICLEKKKQRTKSPKQDAEVFAFEKGVKNLLKVHCFLKLQFCP